MADPLSVLGHFLSIRSERGLPREKIAELQGRRLARVLEAASRTAHYGPLLQSSGAAASAFGSLAALPTTRKEHVRASPESFLPQGGPPSFQRFTTSGSTGIPLVVHFDREAAHERIACGYVSGMEFGRRPFDRLASLYEVPSPLHPLRGPLFFPEMSLSILDGPKTNFARLLRWKPHVISSFPSVVAILARMNLAQPRPLRLKAVHTRGEALPPSLRAAIEKSFSCRVHDQYGLNEIGLVAWECALGSMHVNAGSSIVEIMDSRGRPRKSGKGELVVTGLINRAMPLLRYLSGDTAEWGRPCGCGSAMPVLKSLEGRNDDFIMLPSGRPCSPTIIDPMSNSPDLLEYQLVQESDGTLVFRFIPRDGARTESIEGAVRSLVARGCEGEPVKLEFESVGVIRRGRTGKLKTVVSKMRGVRSDGD